VGTIGPQRHAIDEQEINQVDGCQARTGGDPFHHFGQPGRQLSRQVSDPVDATGLDDPADDLPDSRFARLGAMIV
jgi:hypothetical protein